MEAAMELMEEREAVPAISTYWPGSCPSAKKPGPAAEEAARQRSRAELRRGEVKEGRRRREVRRSL
jgi:hypothetical protein